MGSKKEKQAIVIMVLVAIVSLAWMYSNKAIDKCVSRGYTQSYCETVLSK